MYRFATSQTWSPHRHAIEVARGAKSFGVILGTLGRQGNPHILEHLTSVLRAKGKQYFVLLLSEVFPAKVRGVNGHNVWLSMVLLGGSVPLPPSISVVLSGRAIVVKHTLCKPMDFHLSHPAFFLASSRNVRTFRTYSGSV